MLTQEKLKLLLDYDQETGLFLWGVTLGCRAKKGNRAGGLDRCGYIEIGINGRQYKAHRLAWLYVYGVWPEFIDHINHVRDDNRIINLRSVSRQENSKNRKINHNNTSGVCGVYRYKSSMKWVSLICVDTKLVNLGYFNDFFEACCVRKSAEIKHGYHENHGK